ncbi:MAG: hypothetical protein ACI4IL_07270 [Eubacterium sp.]
MTNTNDFRKYSYQYDTDYLLSGFNVTRSSAAPKRKPAQPKQQEDERDFKLRENTKVKSYNLIKFEEKQALKKMLLVLGVALAVALFVSVTVFSFALKNQLTREIASTQVKISNAQSENISLQSRLDAMVSISMIDEYAVNKLGMTKMKSNQIQYMDVSEYKQNRLSENAKSTPADMAKELKSNK